jgi:hypothetical protein
MRFQWFDRGFKGMVLSMLLAALIAGCHKDAPSTPSGEEVRVPDQEARDFTLTESSEGKKSWTLWSAYAAMYNDKNLVDARTVRIDFFDREGKKNSTLTADQPRLPRTSDLEARGGVHVTPERRGLGAGRSAGARRNGSRRCVRVGRNGGVERTRSGGRDARALPPCSRRGAEVQPQAGVGGRGRVTAGVSGAGPERYTEMEGGRQGHRPSSAARWSAFWDRTGRERRRRFT